jgi:hypothetical protein
VTQYGLSGRGQVSVRNLGYASVPHYLQNRYLECEEFPRRYHREVISQLNGDLNLGPISLSLCYLKHQELDERQLLNGS